VGYHAINHNKNIPTYHLTSQLIIHSKFASQSFTISSNFQSSSPFDSLSKTNL